MEGRAHCMPALPGSPDLRRSPHVCLSASTPVRGLALSGIHGRAFGPRGAAKRRSARRTANSRRFSSLNCRSVSDRRVKKTLSGNSRRSNCRRGWVSVRPVSGGSGWNSGTRGIDFEGVGAFNLRTCAVTGSYRRVLRTRVLRFADRIRLTAWIRLKRTSIFQPSPCATRCMKSSLGSVCAFSMRAILGCRV